MILDKAKMAHEYFRDTMAFIRQNNIEHKFDEIIKESWEYADAMQAEADKRKPSGLPEALRSEVDWRIAPSWAKYWVIRDSSSALWCTSKPTCTDDLLISHGPCSPAPTFGFTSSHIVERPHDL